jgi:hypothetical protein
MFSARHPDQWATVDPLTFERLQATFLGSDEPAASRVRSILTSDVYQPDSFTVGERLANPGWLDASERDHETWLYGLVARRLNAALHLPADHQEAAVLNVLGETWRVLDYKVGDHAVADGLWNQEVPYLIDRIIAWSLHGDADRSFDVTGGFNERGRILVMRLLSRYADQLNRLDTVTLTRISIAAGLLGLDEKGGQLRCAPIYLPRPSDPSYGLADVWQRLSAYGLAVPAVDHIEAMLSHVASGEVRLVWWLDDLIETAFDLLVIQRLLTVNPRLRVTVVPKNGQHDNDASFTDVMRFMRLPDLAGLDAAMSTGRLHVSRVGPRMATANPLKLHPTVVEDIASCDLMFCKGGRVHEMFSGNINKPMFTAYVVVRSFTEAQAGVDSTDAPLMFFGASPGEWPWWGFQGRSERTLTLPSGRTVAACYTTVAEHAAHVRMRNPARLMQDLERLVNAWPTLRRRYSAAARAEIGLLVEGLAPHASALPPSSLPALQDAHTISSTGEITHDNRHV